MMDPTQGHEAAVRALLSQLEGAVKLAGFSVTEAWLMPELLHDEPASDQLFLVLRVAGFQRQDDRLKLWDRIIDLVLDNEDPCISERLTLILQRAEPEITPMIWAHLDEPTKSPSCASAGRANA